MMRYPMCSKGIRFGSETQRRYHPIIPIHIVATVGLIVF